MKKLFPLSIAAASLCAAAAGAAPFRVHQFAVYGSPLSSKGCAECGAPPSCEPARAESVPFADYARDRWVSPRGMRLVGVSCVADAADLLLGKSGVALAAIRLADDPPRQALLDLSPKTPPSAMGWPAPPTRRQQGPNALRPAPRGDPALLRLAVVCWPSVEGWPVPADRQGTAAGAVLDPKNPCEWWLLPFKARGSAGELEPDLTARSFLVVPNSRETFQGRFHARRDWPEVFTDTNKPIEDALESGWDVAPVATDAALAASAGAMTAGASTAGSATSAAPESRAAEARPSSAATRPTAQAALGVCPADVATANPAVFGRFAAWADRFGVSEGQAEPWRPSGWQGRCGAYEVLRSALEERLGCRLDVEACARQDDARTGGSK